MNKRTVIGGAIVLWALAGCGTTAPHPAPAESNVVTAGKMSHGLCGEAIPAELGVKLSLVGQQRAAGQLYRALAVLDGLPGDSPTYRLLRADIQRQLGHRDEARSLYRGLADSCLSGRALHGLGLIAAAEQRTNSALAYLQQARTHIPANADLRNDLGFLLLALGRDRAARAELLTALELDSDHYAAARNLLLLLLRQREDQAARALAQRYGWPEEDHQVFLAAAARFTPIEEQSDD